MTSKKRIGRIIAPIAALAMMAALATGCGGGGGGSAAQSSSNLKLRIELPRDAMQGGEESYTYTYNALINVTSYDATGAPTTVASTTSTLTYNETTHKMTGTFFITSIPVGSNYVVAAHVSSSDSHGGRIAANGGSSTFAHVGAVVDTISDGVTADVAVNTASSMKALALMYFAKSRGVALSNTSVVTSSVKTAIGDTVDDMIAANSEIGYQFTSDYNTGGDPYDPANWAEQLATGLSGIVTEAGLGPQAIGTVPQNGALSVPYDETVFGIVFNQSMDNTVNLNDSATLLASAFNVMVTGGEYSVTIDRTNAMYYGTFSWTTTTVPNDTLSFTLFPSETLISNEVYPLAPETTYSVSMNVPANLLTLSGEAMPVPDPFTGTFTTMPEVDNRVYDNARLTGQYVGMSICPGGSEGYTWITTEKYVITANGAGAGTWENLASSYEDPEDSTTGAFTYYVLADGTLLIVDSDPEESSPYLYGTITADGSIGVNSELDMIEGQSNCLDVVVKKGTGMTMSAAAGSYIINEYGAEVGQSVGPRIASGAGICSSYTDQTNCEEASGCYWDGYFCEAEMNTSGYPVIMRNRATLDSSGNITMTQLSSSAGRIANQGGSYTYTLASDGALGISYEGQPTDITGYVAIGGNVVVMVDTDGTDGYISLMVGVRESTSFSASSMIGHSYVLHQTGADYYYDGYSASSWYMSPELGLFSVSGSGVGTYATLCPEYWVNGTTENPGEPAEFTGSSDGTFSLVGDDGVGIVSPDGNIIVMSDTNLSSDDWINFTVGVRKTPVSGD